MSDTSVTVAGNGPRHDSNAGNGPRPEGSAPEGPRYDFNTAEPKWQQAWDALGCFHVQDVPTDGKP